MKIRDYLLQIVFIPLFTVMLVMTSEIDVEIILSIGIILLSLLTGYSLGLDYKGDEKK